MLILAGERGFAVAPLGLWIWGRVSGGSDASGLACGYAGQAASIAPGQELPALRASNGRPPRAPGATICSRRYASAGYKATTRARRDEWGKARAEGPTALSRGREPTDNCQRREPRRGDSDPSRRQNVYAPGPQCSEVENRGKAVSGHELGVPTHRFARALLQTSAQSRLEKSKISSHGRAVTCRSAAPAKLPFCARKGGMPRESIEGALCARASLAIIRHVFDNRRWWIGDQALSFGSGNPGRGDLATAYMATQARPWHPEDADSCFSGFRAFELGV